MQKENNIEIHMEDGWYKGRFGINQKKRVNIFGDEYKLFYHIIIEFNDWEITNILTDESWKVKNSKEVSNNIYNEEEIDFTIPEKPLKDVVISQEKYNLILDLVSLRIEKKILIPDLHISPKGEQILDFKHNMVGFVRFKGIINKEQEVKLSHGEIYNKFVFIMQNTEVLKQY